MATSLQQPTARPLPNFATSPPDQAFFNMPDPPPQSASNRNMNGNHDTQHRLSTDFKGNDTAAYTNGNGPLPVPNGLPHPIPNGTSRHRGTVSMGAFEGPRSPSNTKSMLLHPTMRWAREKADSIVIRYFPRPLQILPNRAMSGGKGLSILAFHRYITSRYTVQILRQGMKSHVGKSSGSSRHANSSHRETASLALSARWRIFFPTEDVSTDRMHLWAGNCLSVEGWILSCTNSRIRPWHIHS